MGDRRGDSVVSVDRAQLRLAVNDFSTPWWTVLALLTSVAYFGIQEGLWGASIGKRVVGLRVVIASGVCPDRGLQDRIAGTYLVPR